MRFQRKAASAGFGVGLASILVAAGAWACVPTGSGSAKKLTVSPTQAQPGETITVSLPSSARASSVEVRLNASDGPLLGSLVTGPAPAGASSVSATFTLPLDVKPGQHALIAVQPRQRWEPAALAVALPDGTVPDIRGYSAGDVSQGGGGGGRRTALSAIVGVAVLGLFATAIRFRVISRRSQVTPSPAPAVGQAPLTDAPVGR